MCSRESQGKWLLSPPSCFRTRVTYTDQREGGGDSEPLTSDLLHVLNPNLPSCPLLKAYRGS